MSAANGAVTWAVVPVKDFDRAKQRLAPVLSAAERRGLFVAMLEDVLSCLAQAERLAGIVLVTKDEEAKALARRYRAEVLEERENLGHTEAVSFAAKMLGERRSVSMLTLPADIPLVTPAEIAALIDGHGREPALTIAPSADELGSNAMLCSPPDVLPFGFGANSFRPHLERARARGIEPRIVRRPGLELDIDAPADLRHLAGRPSATRAYDYLRRSGIAARLRAPSAALDRPL